MKTPVTAEEVAEFFRMIDTGVEEDKDLVVYDRMVDLLGSEKTRQVWNDGCNLYDTQQAAQEDAGRTQRLFHEPVPDGQSGPWNRKPHARSFTGMWHPSAPSMLTYDARCAACRASAL